jgi:hypothetical protein
VIFTNYWKQIALADMSSLGDLLETDRLFLVIGKVGFGPAVNADSLEESWIKSWQATAPRWRAKISSK